MALNTLIMVTKSYIFSNSRIGLELKMEDLLMLQKRIYSEQKLVANLKMKNVRFEKCWYQMQKKYLFMITTDTIPLLCNPFILLYVVL